MIPAAEIPIEYDYRNINGYDFTSNHILYQGGCGACYTLGFVQSVNSRLKLKYGKDVEDLSP